MWSEEYQKNVFIDFGMSMVVKEKPGQRTLTHYFGTYGFCCDDMRKLLFEQKVGYVDLYHNDVYALRKVFEDNLDNRFSVQMAEK